MDEGESDFLDVWSAVLFRGPAAPWMAAVASEIWTLRQGRIFLCAAFSRGMGCAADEVTVLPTARSGPPR